MPVPPELQAIIDLARAAGRLVLQQQSTARRMTKRHDEAVTEADRASQRLIVEGLRKLHPGDGVIGEENDTGSGITFDCPDPRGRVWVIDPIDGTNNFIAGFGAFAVCIGLLDQGEPVLGVVHDATRDWTYAAQRGRGAYLNGEPIRALTTPLNSSTVIMSTSNLLGKDSRPPQWAIRWISQTTWKIRILGSAALDSMQVAAGVAHGSVTVNGKLWDIAAPAAILLEAGAVLTDLRGQRIFPFDLAGYDGAKVPFLSAGPAAHEELLREILWHP